VIAIQGPWDYLGDEPVTLADDGFQDMGLVRVVPQSIAQFVDGGIDAVAGVYVDVVSPEALADLFSSDQPALILDEKNEKLQGVLFEFDHTIAAAQFVAPEVQFKIFKLKDFSRQNFPQSSECGKYEARQTGRQPLSFKHFRLQQNFSKPLPWND
jgi:hypothetical protein